MEIIEDHENMKIYEIKYENIEDHETYDVHSSAIAFSVGIRDLLLVGKMGTNGRGSSE